MTLYLSPVLEIPQSPKRSQSNMAKTNIGGYILQRQQTPTTGRERLRYSEISNH